MTYVVVWEVKECNKLFSQLCSDLQRPRRANKE